MTFLALDLGSSTGWALGGAKGMISGSWELATPKQLKAADTRCCDPRVNALHNKIVDVLSLIPQDEPREIYFEDVQFASSTYQVQLWASLRGVVMLHCGNIKVHGVPVGTLKKFATGSGNADKEQMARALVAKEPGVFVPRRDADPKWVFLRKPPLNRPDSVYVTDDEVDARHLLWFALAKQ